MSEDDPDNAPFEYSDSILSQMKKDCHALVNMPTKPGIWDNTPVFVNPCPESINFFDNEEPANTRKASNNVVFLENKNGNLVVSFRIRSVLKLAFKGFKNAKLLPESNRIFARKNIVGPIYTITIEFKNLDGLYDAGNYTWIIDNGVGYCMASWEVYYNEKEHYPTWAQAALSQRCVCFDRSPRKFGEHHQVTTHIFHSVGGVFVPNPQVTYDDVPRILQTFKETTGSGDKYLSVIFSSNNAIKITWAKYNEIISEATAGTRLNVFKYTAGANKETRLVFNRLSNEDCGVYVCILFNGSGFALTEFHLLDLDGDACSDGNDPGYEHKGIIRYEWPANKEH